MCPHCVWHRGGAQKIFVESINECLNCSRGHSWCCTNLECFPLPALIPHFLNFSQHFSQWEVLRQVKMNQICFLRVLSPWCTCQCILSSPMHLYCRSEWYDYPRDPLSSLLWNSSLISPWYFSQSSQPTGDNRKYLGGHLNFHFYSPQWVQEVKYL